MSRPPLQIAIVQMPMAWTLAENLETMLVALSAARACYPQLDICCFPELALTGFHRHLPREAAPKALQEAQTTLAEASRRHHVGVLFGAPLISDDGDLQNAYLGYDAIGQASHTIVKQGLTPSEIKAFKPGISRDVASFRGWRWSAVLCREILDHDLVCSVWGAEVVDLLFWPSFIAYDGSHDGYTRDPLIFAQTLSCFVVQCNWPHSLNVPATTGMGRSVVIAPNGESCAACPPDEAGIGFISLPDGAFSWHSWSTLFPHKGALHVVSRELV